jgi:hypothetical protein
MLKLTRFIGKSDVKDVTLVNPADAEKLDVGHWITPNADGKYIISDSETIGTDAATKLARMVYSENGRTDVRSIRKISTIRGGGIEGLTDQYIGSSFTLGADLTLGIDSDDLVKFKAATSGDVVKAVVIAPLPSAGNPVLAFELVD